MIKRVISQGVLSSTPLRCPDNSMKNILLFILFLIIGAAITIGYFKFSEIKKEAENRQVFSPYSGKDYFTLDKAPTESLKGEIISFNGDVGWQSRTATESSQIKGSISVGQGEKIVTKEGGNAEVKFDNICDIKLSENTSLELIQTLPLNFVFLQEAGTVQYARLGSVPIAVRSLGLVMQIEDFQSSVSVNIKNSTVTVTVASGSADLAYNDINYNTNKLTLAEGQKMIFNNQTKSRIIQ